MSRSNNRSSIWTEAQRYHGSAARQQQGSARKERDAWLKLYASLNDAQKQTASDSIKQHWQRMSQRMEHYAPARTPVTFYRFLPVRGREPCRRSNHAGFFIRGTGGYNLPMQTIPLALMANHADLLLLELGLAPSRTAAQNLIERPVACSSPNGQRTIVAKSSQKPDCGHRVVRCPRSGRPLCFARRAENVWRIATYRLNSGGYCVAGCRNFHRRFTDCLLRSDAARVIGIDVGHSQLAPKLWPIRA